MKTKFKLAFDELENVMEMMTISEILSAKGGEGPQNGDVWTVNGYTFVYDASLGQWVGSLPEITITSSSSDPYSWNWSNYLNGYTGSFSYSSSGYSGTISPGGGGGSGSGTAPTLSVVDIAAMAIQNGLAFNSFYNTLDAARLGQLPLEAKDIVHNLLQSNPGSALIDDIKAAGSLNGVAVLSAAGKVLGFTQAGVSLYNLYQDIADDDGTVSMVNVADAVISVGSLFIKSNILGATVSMGWLIIKGAIDEN
ncbi:hypothetical protein DBR40_13230 [Pedobacter sp. KBW01]|uniref:hypothetical protein n=1 Tax=Pedobacter sp. KBW01 TaxID=2153364 RepID=UPI000F591038|nr:hypothetical protein [Pedobacter sp. KBW01]RQO73766.1 hypothetical protein DBR40_13230 [Pedobacter sp. KBW01]